MEKSNNTYNTLKSILKEFIEEYNFIYNKN